MLGEHLSLIRLGEDGAHHGGHYGLGGLGHLGQQVAPEVPPAARPGGPCRVAASAALSPKWSSEIASCTPVSPLCGRSRRTLSSRPGAKPTSKRDPAGQQQEDDNDGDDAEQDVEHSPSAALETSLHGLPPSKPTTVAPRFPRRDSSETIPSPGAGSC